MSRMPPLGEATFGQVLRALRMGFGWSKKRKAWIRISPAGDDRFRVDVVPGNTNIDGHNRVSEFFCWWEDPDPDGLLDRSEMLKGISDPGKTMMFFLNNHGDHC